VLKGARRTLGDSRVLVVIMETNGSGARFGVSDDELVAEMRRFGFAMCAYDPFERRLEETGKGGGNTIFVRDAAAVDVRLRSAQVRTCKRVDLSAPERREVWAPLGRTHSEAASG
jgi:hypothetical protein